MTETDWFSCTDHHAMWDFLRTIGWPSDRKCRLFACTCLRTDTELRDGASAEELLWFDMAEAYAENSDSQQFGMIEIDDPQEFASTGYSRLVSSLHYHGWYTENDAIPCDLLREIIGPLLFRSPGVDPAWLTWNSGTVRRLAESAYTDRELPSGHLDPRRLAVLADSLEEAGAGDSELVTHLRSPGPHVRGCWVLDLLLGRV